MRRVVVTGMSATSPIGNTWPEVLANLQAGNSGIVRQDDWDRYKDLRTRLAAPVKDFSTPSHYSRKSIRGMGRVALMATRASELALEDAGLLNVDQIKTGNTGVQYDP